MEILGTCLKKKINSSLFLPLFANLFVLYRCYKGYFMDEELKKEIKEIYKYRRNLFRKENKMDKFKKIMKYVVNGLNFLNAILIGITPIWNIPYGDEISKTFIVIAGAISVYLLGQKAVEKREEEK